MKTFKMICTWGILGALAAGLAQGCGSTRSSNNGSSESPKDPASSDGSESLSNGSKSNPSGPEPTNPTGPSSCSANPIAIADGEQAPFALAVVGESIFWTTAIDGVSSVRGKRTAATSAETISQRSRQVGGLARFEDRLVWAERGLAETDTGTIIALRPAQASEEALAAGTPTNLIDEYSIAADQSAVYWVTHETKTLTQRVWRLPSAGGTPEKLGEVSLPIDQNITRLVADGDWLYWATPSGWMYRLQKAGGVPELMVDDLNGIGAYDVVGGRIVYSDLGSPPSLFSVTPRQAPITLAKNTRARFGLVLSGNDVLFGGDTGIFSVPYTGGQPQLLVSAEPVGSVVVWDDSIVWSEVAVGGAVRSMCRPSASIPIECPPPGIALRQACATVQWVVGPAVAADNRLRVKLWAPTAGPNGPYTDIEGALQVTPWMPEHGHGSTAPTITREEAGVYSVADLNLFMPGLWDLRHLWKVNEQVKDELTITVDVR